MSFSNLPSNHFLAQPRPDSLLPQPAGLVDTTTLAAHDFDVDNRTGFMPPQPPLARLPSPWEIWESHLDAAISQKLQLAERVERLGTMAVETDKSRFWRGRVVKMPCLPIEELTRSERALRRAHLVLAWLLHFYVHTIPSTETITIPRSLTIPLLQISSQLQLPPVLTYSDTVLYNWAYKESYNDEMTSNKLLPTIHNIQGQTSFTGTTDEEEFYLTSARIELRGTEVLELMRLGMDEVFVGDDIATRRITGYLERMAAVILELRDLLLATKETVDPDVFYHQIRPWVRGVDSDSLGQRPCIFEGREEVEGWTEMPEVSGASAGQSSLIQALDIYLGVDAEAPQTSFMPHPSKKSFQERMRAYMPRHHRGFLNHLRGNTRGIRAFVQSVTEKEEECEYPILAAYNAAVKALKEFRDAHFIVTTLFIVLPARRASKVAEVSTDVPQKEQENEVVKGTGGTDLTKFLKGIRDQTVQTYLLN